MKRGAGKIYLEPSYAACCGKCLSYGDVYHHHGYALAVKEFREMGWKKTKSHGWVCPRCAKETE